MEMTDSLARVIMLIGIAVFAPVGIYHRLRSRTGEHLDRRQEGWPILVGLRLLALAYLVGLIAFLIEPSLLAWASFYLPNWARWSGAVLGALAGGLFVWTFRSLGHNLTDTVVTRRDATLVTHGPYRWVRHPFYLAFAIAVIANALVTAQRSARRRSFRRISVTSRMYPMSSGESPTEIRVTATSTGNSVPSARIAARSVRVFNICPFPVARQRSMPRRWARTTCSRGASR